MANVVALGQNVMNLLTVWVVDTVTPEAPVAMVPTSVWAEAQATRAAMAMVND